MGDRAVWGFRESTTSPTIYLYGHWGGHRMMNRLCLGLVRVKAAGRENDASYATRIMVSDMVSDHEDDLGWGITLTVPGDVQRRIPVVTWGRYHQRGLVPATVGLWEIPNPYSGVGYNAPTECIFLMGLDDFIARYEKEQPPLSPTCPHRGDYIMGK